MAKLREYTEEKCLKYYVDGPTNKGEWLRPTATANISQHLGNLSLPIHIPVNMSTVSRPCGELIDCFPPSFEGKYLDFETMGHLVECNPTGAHVPVIDVVLRSKGWSGVDDAIMEDPCRIVETSMPTCRCAGRTGGIDCITMVGVGTISFIISSLMTMLFLIQLVVTMLRLRRNQLRRKFPNRYAYRIRLYMLICMAILDTSGILWNVAFVLDMAVPFYMATLGNRVVRYLSYTGGTACATAIQLLTVGTALHFLRTAGNEKRIAHLFAGSIRRMKYTILVIGITYHPAMLICIFVWGLATGSIVFSLFMMISEVLFIVGYFVLKRSRRILQYDKDIQSNFSDVIRKVEHLERSIYRIIIVIFLQMVAGFLAVSVFYNRVFYVIPYVANHCVGVILVELLWHAFNPKEQIQPEPDTEMRETVSSVGTLGFHN